ncbi:MAG: GNAT family N-acetyltransferase [Clostridia bacterium]|nr:GNAT family N-acetyltransferase [Clostridia bacterium]
MDNKMTASNCLNMQYELLKDMYFDNKTENENYILGTSDVIDDYFWNIAYLKTEFNKEMLDNLESIFKSINRNPSIYISKSDIAFESNKNLLIDNKYVLNDKDVYMELKNPNKSNISLNIKVVENEEEYNDYMKVIASAYNDNIENPEENVYADAITDCYYKAIKKSINDGIHYHIIAYDNNVPVSVATLSYKDKIGGINNVGTAQGYWNKGYGKQVITYVINKFEELGGGILTLSTEYQSKNQQFYEKLGFEEMYVMEQYMKEI